jgi:hypothetical protein
MNTRYGQARRVQPRGVERAFADGSGNGPVFLAKIDQLAAAPEELANIIKQLAGGEGLMRLRVGDWRVVYRDGQVLAIIRIASTGGER